MAASRTKALTFESIGTVLSLFRTFTAVTSYRIIHQTIILPLSLPPPSLSLPLYLFSPFYKDYTIILYYRTIAYLDNQMLDILHR